MSERTLQSPDTSFSRPLSLYVFSLSLISIYLSFHKRDLGMYLGGHFWYWDMPERATRKHTHPDYHALCSSVLQCVAVCCSVLQCTTARLSTEIRHDRQQSLSHPVYTDTCSIPNTSINFQCIHKHIPRSLQASPRSLKNIPRSLCVNPSLGLFVSKTRPQGTFSQTYIPGSLSFPVYTVY